MSDPDYGAEVMADMGTCGEEDCIWCGLSKESDR